MRLRQVSALGLSNVSQNNLRTEALAHGGRLGATTTHHADERAELDQFAREIARHVEPAAPNVGAEDWAAAAETGRRIDGTTGQVDESVAGLIEMRLQRFLADLAAMTEDFHRTAQRSRDKLS